MYVSCQPPTNQGLVFDLQAKLTYKILNMNAIMLNQVFPLLTLLFFTMYKMGEDIEAQIFLYIV